MIECGQRQVGVWNMSTQLSAREDIGALVGGHDLEGVLLAAEEGEGCGRHVAGSEAGLGHLVVLPAMLDEAVWQGHRPELELAVQQCASVCSTAQAQHSLSESSRMGPRHSQGQCRCHMMLTIELSPSMHNQLQ